MKGKLAIRIFLWFLAILGSIIFYLLLNHLTIYYIIENNIPSFVFNAWIFLIPLAFWLWGKIVKPFDKKYIVFTIFIIALIFYISQVIDSYKGIQAYKKLKEEGIL